MPPPSFVAGGKKQEKKTKKPAVGKPRRLHPQTQNSSGCLKPGVGKRGAHAWKTQINPEKNRGKTKRGVGMTEHRRIGERGEA